MHEDILIDITSQHSFSSFSPAIRLALFMGAMAFSTTALVCMTSFTRIVIVLSFTRRALAMQDIPPTPVLLGLALILTYHSMSDTLHRIEVESLRPLLNNSITPDEALTSALRPVQDFMLYHTRSEDLRFFNTLADKPHSYAPGSTTISVLAPAFITSELKTSFTMGLFIYLPFLLVDLIVSVFLMSLGMMMMPPSLVSTPIKLLLFVMLDGWNVVTQALYASIRQ